MTSEDQVRDLRTMAMVNYGHFTSMRVDRDRDGSWVRGLGAHLDRLDRDARVVFGRGIPADRVRAEIRSAVEGHEGPLYVKVNAFARDLAAEVDEHDPSLLVSVHPLPARAPAFRVGTVGYERDLPRVKHVGTFGLVHQRRLARRRGFDDALFVNRDGEISEGTTWNVCFVAGDTVVWPGALVLPGVTMRLLREGLAAAGVPVETRPVTPAELPGFRAAFASSALAPVRVVEQVDDIRLPGDEEFRRLLVDTYEKIPGEPV